MFRWLGKLALGNPWAVGSLAGLLLAGLVAAYWLGRSDGGALTEAANQTIIEGTIHGVEKAAERARSIASECRRRRLQYDPERHNCAR